MNAKIVQVRGVIYCKYSYFDISVINNQTYDYITSNIVYESRNNIAVYVKIYL